MDHAHLCGALHLRGSQWLPLHVVAVSLSSPVPPPHGPSLSSHSSFCGCRAFVCYSIYCRTWRNWVSRVKMRSLTGIKYFSRAKADLFWISDCRARACIPLGAYLTLLRQYHLTNNIPEYFVFLFLVHFSPCNFHFCSLLLHRCLHNHLNCVFPELLPQLCIRFASSSWLRSQDLTACNSVSQAVFRRSEGRPPPTSAGHDSRHKLHSNPSIIVYCES